MTTLMSSIVLRVFASNRDEFLSLECNTGKDKEKLHHRTAGARKILLCA